MVVRNSYSASPRPEGRIPSRTAMGVKKERSTARVASPRRGRYVGLFRNPRIRSRSSAARSSEPARPQSPVTPGSPRGRLSGPIQFALKLADFWRLSQDELAGLLGFGDGDTAHAAELLTGRTELHGRDVRDRTAHLFRIRESLHTLFRDLEVENEWLREPHELLEGESPMSLMVGGSMEDLLLVREYVDEVAGS